MKFHETHYEEYVEKVEKSNIHEELEPFYKKLPSKLENFRNLILYGPVGTGKYSQALKIIKKYSPSDLKYEKKMNVMCEKGEFSYKLSDVHFEVDLMLLGCNSKVIWHELFSQIVEVVSVRREKMAIILCKNFHTIHSELLDIFYSYMQQYNHNNLAIQLRFILISEHISFLPLNIINHCYRVPIRRPKKQEYKRLGLKFNIEPKYVTNLKEIKSIQLLSHESDIGEDLYDKILTQLLSVINEESINYSHIRETLYDLLIYNLDIQEVIMGILDYYVEKDMLKKDNIDTIMSKMPVLLKQYNNNYRPIYHLESIFLTITNELQYT